MIQSVAEEGDFNERMLLALWLVLTIDLQIKVFSIHDVKTACTHAPDKGLVAHIHIVATD